jgi:hypothetical protein
MNEQEQDPSRSDNHIHLDEGIRNAIIKYTMEWCIHQGAEQRSGRNKDPNNHLRLDEETRDSSQACCGEIYRPRRTWEAL